MKKEWNPEEPTIILLERAMEHIKSVPYKVTSRWLFYRLLQEGYFKSKEDDGPLVGACRKARKEFYGEWRPDTLVDKTRGMIERIGGAEDIDACVDKIPEKAHSVCHWAFKLDHFYQQEHYIEIWFEARGMIGQFEYYTDSINLVPFGGDTSIPLKWDIAKHLEVVSEQYGKPIVILYFGDADEKGLQIPKSAVNDVRKWCEVDFELERCGLTLEQAEKFQLPEDPKRPNQYQWAALSDEQAKEIITSSLEKYIDQSIIDNLGEQRDAAIGKWKGLVEDSLKRLVKREKKKEVK